MNLSSPHLSLRPVSGFVLCRHSLASFSFFWLGPHRVLSFCLIPVLFYLLTVTFSHFFLLCSRVFVPRFRCFPLRFLEHPSVLAFVFQFSVFNPIAPSRLFILLTSYITYLRAYALRCRPILPTFIARTYIRTARTLPPNQPINDTHLIDSSALVPWTSTVKCFGSRGFLPHLGKNRMKARAEGRDFFD